MNLWTAHFERSWSGGLAVVAAETEERAKELLREDNKDWGWPELLLENVNCDEGVLDSDHYSE